jgi:hypothetical protein
MYCYVATRFRFQMVSSDFAAPPASSAFSRTDALLDLKGVR